MHAITYVHPYMYMAALHIATKPGDIPYFLDPNPPVIFVSAFPNSELYLRAGCIQE